MRRPKVGPRLWRQLPGRPPSTSADKDVIWAAHAEFLEDLSRLDAQLRDTKKKLSTAVRASGTTLTEIFGVGPSLPPR
jgi:hypothetical protein